ncbi:MAG: hypothetical protein ACJ8DI_18965 [Ktedonobacteraceae bacterium]
MSNVVHRALATITITIVVLKSSVLPECSTSPSPSLPRSPVVRRSDWKGKGCQLWRLPRVRLD